MFLVPFFDLQNFILLVRTVPFLRKIFFISSYTAKNNYFLLYELIQDLPYLNSVTVNIDDQRWRTKQSETSTRVFIGKITVSTYTCRYGPASPYP